MTVPNINTSKSLRANTDLEIQKAFDEAVSKEEEATKQENKPVEPTREQMIAQKIALEKSSESKVVVHPGTKFYWGKFSQRSNPSDPETVRIAVEGETLQFQRGKRVLLPEPYLVAANNTSFPIFSREPSKEGRAGGLTIIGNITTYKFECENEEHPLTGQDAYNEFKSSLHAGTNKTKEAVSRWGLNIPKDMGVPQLT